MFIEIILIVNEVLFYMMSTKPFCIFLFFFIGLLGSCRSDAGKLTPADLQHIDTLYTREIIKLAPLLDSLCEVRRDSLLQIAADSMIKVRMDEMEKILNRQ